MNFVFGVVYKMLSTNPGSHRFSPAFSSKMFIVFHFIFRYVINFKLIFV